MTDIYFSPESLTDLTDIQTYIREELGNPQAADRTVADVLQQIQTLSAFPERGTPLSSIVAIATNYRFLVCGNYLVFYRFENASVSVVRILYGRRNYMQILFGGAI